MSVRKNNLTKARLWAKRIQKLPGVRAVFLSGSLATNTDNDNSDIDFFIVAEAGKIFTARFFVALVLKVFFQLAKPQNHAGKICPNHFVTTCSLMLNEKNKYTAHMFACNQFLAGDIEVWKHFQAENKWIDLFGEAWGSPVSISNLSSLAIPSVCWIEKLIERGLKFLQIKKIKRNANFHTSEKIVLTDKELRFHPVLKSKN